MLYRLKPHLDFISNDADVVYFFKTNPGVAIDIDAGDICKDLEEPPADLIFFTFKDRKSIPESQSSVVGYRNHGYINMDRLCPTLDCEEFFHVL